MNAKNSLQMSSKIVAAITDRSEQLPLEALCNGLEALEAEELVFLMGQVQAALAKKMRM